MGSPERLRILYVCLQGLEGGQGAPTHVEAVVRGLSEDHDVVLLAPDPGGGHRLLPRAWRMLRLLVRGARLGRGADVVYCRHHPMVAPLTWLLSRRGVPQVQEVNGPIADFTSVYPQLGPLGPVLQRLSTTALRDAALVVCVSDALAELVARTAGLPAERLLVVHNGADLTRFGPSDAAGRGAVFIGALTPWQGLSTLRDALDDPSWPEGLELVVAGAGPSRDELQGAPAARVRMLGAVPHAQVPDLLAGALCSISPKTVAARWSSPLKVYEAIAAGVPSVVTDVGEQADVIRRTGAGVVVPPGDAAALARAVGRIAGDPQHRAALAAAARHARTDIGWDRRVERLEKALRTVAVGGRRRRPLRSSATMSRRGR